MKVINLLPKSRQQDLYYESILHSLFNVIRLSIFSFVVVLVVQFSVQFYLADQSQALGSNIEQLKGQVNKQENVQLKLKIQAINGIVSDYKNLADASPKWSKVLASFAVLPPEGVKISSFNVDLSNRSVAINGTSPTRELVIKLYENILADTDHFYGIDYPLENIVNARNVNFHFNFFMRDTLLK